jgi:hypothetical protein
MLLSAGKHPICPLNARYDAPGASVSVRSIHLSHLSVTAAPVSGGQF